MSDPFTDLMNALAPFVGGSTIVAGGILALGFIVALWVAMEIFLSETRHGKQGGALDTFMMAAMIGTVFTTIFGWLPVFVPFLWVFYILWVLLDPFNQKQRSTP